MRSGQRESSAMRTGEQHPRECGCPTHTHCPGRRMDPFVGRRLPLVERVRRVAAELAGICTGMDEAALADCFVEMFDMPCDCRMFAEFRAVYQAADARRCAYRGVPVLVKARAVAALLERA
jgi:hypothetical protein